MSCYREAGLVSILFLAFLPAPDAGRTLSLAAEGDPSAKPVTSANKAVAVQTSEKDSSNARAPTTAPAPADKSVPFLIGFDLSGTAENSVAEVSRFTNLTVLGDWSTKAGENRMRAAKDAGMKVVLSLSGNRLPDREARLYNLLKKNPASVHAVLWQAQQVSVEEILAFGGDLKSRYPGIQFWVAGATPNNTALQGVPDADSVDVIVWEVWSNDPGRAYDEVQRIAREPRSRPIVVRWVSADMLHPDGRVPRCKSGVFRSLLAAVHEQQFSGVFLARYGTVAGAVGIAARPELVEEIRTTAEGLSRKPAGELRQLVVESERLYGEGKYADALPHAQRRGQLARELYGSESVQHYTSLILLWLIHDAMGSRDNTAPLLDQAQAIRKRILGEFDFGYAESLHMRAYQYMLMSEYAKAKTLCVQALDIRKKTLGETHPAYARSLRHLGQVYYYTGEYAKAELLYVRTLEVHTATLGDDRSQYASSVRSLANLYCEMGDYAKAEPLYIQALEIYRKANGDNHPDCMQGLVGLADFYCSIGDYAKAEPLYVQARQICTKHLGENDLWYDRILDRLAYLYCAMGEHAKAEPLYLASLEIAKRTQGEITDSYAISLHDLARVYMSMDEYAKAEPLLLRSQEIKKRILGGNHPSYANGLSSLCELHCAMGEYAKAEPFLLQALKVLKDALGEEHPDYTRNLNGLALLYFVEDRQVAAEPLARLAFQRNQELVHGLLPSLPEAQGLALTEKINCRPDLWIATLRRVPPSSRPDVYSSVWQSRALVTQAITQRRRRLLGSTQGEAVYAQLQSTCQQLAELTLGQPSPDKQEARRGRLSELNQQKEDLEKRLAGLGSEYRRAVEIQQAKPKDLIRLLPEGTAVVDFVRLEDWNRHVPIRSQPREAWQYDAFVLTRTPAGVEDGIPWIQLGSADAIDKAIAQWRQAIAGGGRGESGAVSPEALLRERIWDRLEPYLAGSSRVIIVPAGDLNFLPWGALPGRKPGTVLIEDYALAVTESGQQLCDTLTAPGYSGGGMLLVGGVDYDAQPGEKLPNAAMLVMGTGVSERRSRSPALTGRLRVDFLPGSLTEAEGIRQGTRLEPPPVLLSGSAASEAALRTLMPQSRYIHLATHGFFADESFRTAYQGISTSEHVFGGMGGMITAKRATATARNPLILSGVVLAGANLPPKLDQLGLPAGEDGILTAEEIVNLDLRRTELAVLSACDTGLGNVAGSEGVMGLTRAFHLAGARNVIASLWKVDDHATAALMKLFYYKVWQERKPLIEALREAQLTIYRHPEEIQPLATGSRGPKDLTKPVKLPAGGQPSPRPATAPTKQWAAFIFSGPG